MDFIYLSQVIQAICVDAEAQHYRRMISTEGVFTRGTLYWQLVLMLSDSQSRSLHSMFCMVTE